MARWAIIACKSKPTTALSCIFLNDSGAVLIRIAATLPILLATVQAVADPHPVTFESTGRATIACVCIRLASACHSALGDALAGSERHHWSYEAGANGGVTLDITELCWRKRDVPKMGDGVCCSTGDLNTDLRFFWGEVEKIE